MSGVIIAASEWDAWRRDLENRAAADRERLDAADVPDRLLRALREWKPEAYNCCREPGRYRADCPACGGHRTVRISSHREGRGVNAWCVAGCSQEKILDALAAALDPVDWKSEAIHWWQIATEAQQILHRAERFINWLLDDHAAAEMERAA